MIAYILVSGRPPFKGKTKAEIFKSITESPLLFDHPIWEKISDDAKDFIEKALVKDKSQRATALDLLNHDWIAKMVREEPLEQQVMLDIAQHLSDFRVHLMFY